MALVIRYALTGDSQQFTPELKSTECIVLFILLGWMFALFLSFLYSGTYRS